MSAEGELPPRAGIGSDGSVRSGRWLPHPFPKDVCVEPILSYDLVHGQGSCSRKEIGDGSVGVGTSELIRCELRAATTLPYC